MAFCKFSSEVVMENKTMVDNVFINQFLPTAPDACVKVYLYGLYKCNNAESADNELPHFCNALNMEKEDVISSFLYWQELGLVTVLNTDPVSIRYLPLKNASITLKKYNKDKYKDFNIQIQEVISGRMLTPTEYQQYYNAIESLHIEEAALIMIAKYCVNLKNNSVGYSYILTIAKNWAYEGITTASQVENRLMDLEKASSEIVRVLKALGIKRAANDNEYQLYLNWINNWHLPIEVIVHMAKRDKKFNAGFNKLNKSLETCYKLNFKTAKQIDDYFNQLDEMFGTAKSLVDVLKLQNYDLNEIVENYVANWYALGYNTTALQVITKYCKRRGINRFDTLNSKINEFYNLGLITLEHISSYVNEQLSQDNEILSILKTLNLERDVTPDLRRMFHTWITAWETPKDVLNHAVSLCAHLPYPIYKLNNILSSYFKNNVKTVAEAKKIKVETGGWEMNRKNNKEAYKRDYSEEDLNKLITNIEEVEI